LVEHTVLQLDRCDFDAPRSNHFFHWMSAGCRRLSTHEVVEEEFADEIDELCRET
jgi:hypothetical protein